MISNKNLILITTSTGIFFEALDIAIINLAMPLVQVEYGLTADTVQWVQTLYVLVYGGFLILGGKASDVIGRKIIFISGCTLFLFTSLGAGLSSSFELLAIFRAIQGLAAALMMPSALSIITNTFTEKQERSKALGIFSSFAAIGSGSGLSIGGIIATYWGWQWVFFINVPVIALTILMAYLYIDSDVKTSYKTSLDLFSGLLLTTTLTMISYFVHELGNYAKNYTLLIMLLVAICLSSWLLIRRLSRHKEPLIDMALFSNSTIITTNVVIALLGAIFTGYLFVISLVLQQHMHISAARAGLILFPFSLLSAIVAKILTPKLLKYTNVHITAIIGMVCMLAGTVMLIIATTLQYDFVLILVSVACISGFGIAICFTSLVMLSIQGTPVQHHGVVSSVATTAHFLGAGLGLSLLSLAIQLPLVSEFVTVVPAMVLSVFACVGIGCLLTIQHKSQLEKKILL
ncbi:MFS transporter [Rhodocytophaga rosea]|uniref:MFS transporter n=1 Tax=Rhodocytophaga rosea TaxID=2704465 RepID=A0A6C0GK67_9BACT|nr:MFS transporter [Rhodocytophaga rosea]QHT68214.1 MFS transporter [Rhodocytophaga rosea]